MNKYQATIQCFYTVEFYADEDDDIEKLAILSEDYEIYNLYDFECVDIEMIEEDVKDEN